MEQLRIVPLPNGIIYAYNGKHFIFNEENNTWEEKSINDLIPIIIPLFSRGLKWNTLNKVI